MPIFVPGHWALSPKSETCAHQCSRALGTSPEIRKSALLCSRALFPRNQQVRALGTFPRNQNQKNVAIYVASRALGTFPRHQEKVHFYISGHWALFETFFGTVSKLAHASPAFLTRATLLISRNQTSYRTQAAIPLRTKKI